jgi:hypothetical protein
VGDKVLVGFEFEFDCNAPGYNAELRKLRKDFVRRFHVRYPHAVDMDDVRMMYRLHSRDAITSFVVKVQSYMVLRLLNDEAPGEMGEKYRWMVEAVHGESIWDQSWMDGCRPEVFDQFGGSFLHRTFDLSNKVREAFEDHTEAMFDAIRRVPHNVRRAIPVADAPVFHYGQRLEEAREIELLAWFLQTKTGLFIKDSSEYKGGTDRDYEHGCGYYLERDGINLELISDPAPVPKAIEMLREVCGIMRQYFLTDGGCGVHINVSVKGREASEYDPLKIHLMADTARYLKQFEREHNEFCESMDMPFNGVLKNQLGNSLFVDPYLITARIRAGKPALNRLAFSDVAFRSKFNAINFCNLHGRNPYVEYRMCGGANWEMREDELTECVSHVATATLVGSDPTLRREWYAETVNAKLASLVGPEWRERRAMGGVLGDIKESLSNGYYIVKGWARCAKNVVVYGRVSGAYG